MGFGLRDLQLVSGTKATTIPPTTVLNFLIRRADEAGFSVKEIDESVRVLINGETARQVVATATPESMDPATRTARKIVTTLFQPRQKSGSWKGPLPPPRVSPPLTLGDIPIRSGQRSGDDRRRSKGEHEFQNSNSDPDLERPKFGNGPQRAVWLKDGNTWIRIWLCSGVGRLLARRGTLPLEYRGNLNKTRENLDSGIAKPSYAVVLAAPSVMAGNGGFNDAAGHGHPGGFQGNNRGFQGGVNQGGNGF